MKDFMDCTYEIVRDFFSSQFIHFDNLTMIYDVSLDSKQRTKFYDLQHIQGTYLCVNIEHRANTQARFGSSRIFIGNNAREIVIFTNPWIWICFS